MIIIIITLTEVFFFFTMCQELNCKCSFYSMILVGEYDRIGAFSSSCGRLACVIPNLPLEKLGENMKASKNHQGSENLRG